MKRLLALALLAPALAFAQLPPAVRDALAKAGVPESAVGAVVEPVDGGKRLLDHHSARPLNPASTIKLVTTLAALDLLGPAYTFKTEILATAAEPQKLRDQGRNEPMLMAIGYHKGRVFHSTLGHHAESFECVGFKVTFLRGTEWAATGKVTLTEVPADFPKEDVVSKNPFKLPGK